MNKELDSVKFRQLQEENAALREENAALRSAVSEMERYLPILERAEEMGGGGVWATLAQGTGIATLNGYRAAIEKLK